MEQLTDELAELKVDHEKLKGTLKLREESHTKVVDDFRTMLEMQLARNKELEKEISILKDENIRAVKMSEDVMSNVEVAKHLTNELEVRKEQFNSQLAEQDKRIYNLTKELNATFITN